MLGRDKERKHAVTRYTESDAVGAVINLLPPVWGSVPATDAAGGGCGGGSGQESGGGSGGGGGGHEGGGGTSGTESFAVDRRSRVEMPVNVDLRG
jgi:hypothetical protein